MNAIEQTLELYRNGVSYRAIMHELGFRSRGKVAGIVDRHATRDDRALADANGGAHARNTRAKMAEARSARIRRQEKREAAEARAREIAAQAAEAEEKANLSKVYIWELERHHCRWIDGEPGVDALYCGAPREDGSSYCEAHARKSLKKIKYDIPDEVREANRKRAAWARQFKYGGRHNLLTSLEASMA